MKIKTSSFIWSYTIIWNFNSLSVCYFNTRKIIISYFILKDSCFMCHQKIHTWLIAILNLILNDMTRCLVSCINSTSSTSINLVFLGIQLTILTSCHNSTSNRPRNTIPNQPSLCSWVTENNCPAFWLQITFFYGCTTFFYINC